MSNIFRVKGWYGRLRADQVVASTVSYEKEGQNRESELVAKKIAEGNAVVADLLDKALARSKDVDILVFKEHGEIVFELRADSRGEDISVPGVILENSQSRVDHNTGLTLCHMGILDPLFVSSQYPDTLISRLRKFEDGNGFIFRITSMLDSSTISNLYNEANEAATAAKKIHSLQVQRAALPLIKKGKSFSVSHDEWEGYANVASEYYAGNLRNQNRLLKCEMSAWGKDIDLLLLELSNLKSTPHPFPLDFSMSMDVPVFSELPDNKDVKDVKDDYKIVKNFFEKWKQKDLRKYVTRDALSSILSLCPFEIPGIKYIWEPSFSVNPPSLKGKDNNFSIGQIQSKGQKLAEFKISPERLTEHVFITGKTGSGKTNSCKVIADKLLDHCQIIVLESAKNEYAGWAAEHGAKYFAPGSRDFNDLSLPIFRIPYKYEDGKYATNVPVSEHIGGLWSVISSAFPLEGPMIPLLKRALHKIYEDYGWSLTGENADVFQDIGNPRFPSIEALCEILAKLIDDLGYEGEIRSNIEAALVNRLSDLHVGVRKQIFSESEQGLFSIFDLFNTVQTSPDNHVVISFDNLESEEDKSLALGLFLLRLREQVRMDGIRHNHLRRLVIIEEAHRIVPNIKSEVAINPSVGQQKEQAVARFNDSISEMRAYGVGFIIVDQSPSKVSLDVLRNIGTKIVHSVQEEDDRKAACSILGEEMEIGSYLVGLDRGHALVHTRGMQKSSLVKVAERANHGSMPETRKAAQISEVPVLEPDEVYNQLLRELITGDAPSESFDESVDHLRRNEVDLYSQYGIKQVQGKFHTWQSLCRGDSESGLSEECISCRLRCRIPAILRIVALRDERAVDLNKVNKYSTAKLLLSTIEVWKSRSSNIARSVSELSRHLINECVLDTNRIMHKQTYRDGELESLYEGFTQCLALHSNFDRILADIVKPLAGKNVVINGPKPPANLLLAELESKTRDHDVNIKTLLTQVDRIAENESITRDHDVKIETLLTQVVRIAKYSTILFGVILLLVIAIFLFLSFWK